MLKYLILVLAISLATLNIKIEKTMPNNTAFDTGELKSLAIGYDKLSPELSSDVRFVDGLNMMVTNKGKLKKRPAAVSAVSSGLLAFGLNYSAIDHMIAFDTLESPPQRYIMASVKSTLNGGVYEVWYSNRTTGSAWTQLLDIGLNTNLSTYPHEFVISRGMCYIRASGPSVYGSLRGVVFDGTTQTVNPWGLIGPTTPTAVSASAVAATFNFTVSYGWYYTYTYKTADGQESNRAPLQTDQSKASSSTGPLTSNLCPSVIVQGRANTTLYPNIVIYRSTDGGGNFYRLDEVANTGAGSITYVDRHFSDGLATPAQPYPDSALDTSRISPTLVSNSPPPSCAAQDRALSTLTSSITSSSTTIPYNATFNLMPSILTTGFPVAPNFTITIGSEQMIVTANDTVTYNLTVVRGLNGAFQTAHASGDAIRFTPITGTDASTQSTPMVYFSGRIWYGLDNVLFYSGNEEISTGIPEESWPSGLNGNFYRFDYPITNLISTSEALYIICTKGVYWLKGTTKDSFQVNQIFSDIGGITGHPRAATTADKSIIFLTNDNRICMARGMNRSFLSDPLASILDSAIKLDGSIIHLTRYAYQEKDLLLVLAVNSNLAKCHQWVYDFNQSQDGGIWNVPWSLPISCASSCYTIMYDTQYSATKLSNYLLLGGLTVAGTRPTTNYLDTSFTSVDDWYGSFSHYFTISLVRNPTGNHVNMLREPGMVSILHAIKLDRTAFTGDTDPSVTVYLDNSTGSGGTTITLPSIPPRRIQSTGYDTLWYMVDHVAERVSVNISKPASSEPFEAQIIGFIFNPDAGC